ncbi:MAG: hypothetical protein H0T79_08940, partial [Deltaproteobacteria bacterium]|nr:hypothetical protein [Deltaproteobacteria bacterium]
HREDRVEADVAAPGHGLRVAGALTLATGGAALLTGIVFGALANGAASDVSAASGTWTTELDDRVAEGERNERISLICYGAAAVLATGGAVMFYLGNRASAQVAPTASSTSVGMNVSWSY